MVEIKEKRVSSRAIIFEGDKIMLMFRVKGPRMYHVFPGGKVEEGESFEETVKREIQEEFGIEIEVGKKVYECETPTAYHHYYLCKWIDGIFGTGDGEEFQEGRTSKGYYEPRLVNVKNMPKINLVPKNLAKQVIADLEKYGQDLTPTVIKVYDK